MPQIYDPNMKWECVHCGVRQLVYMGDLTDLTISDCEAVCCYACKKLELIDSEGGEYEFRLCYNIEDEEPITEDIIRKYASIENGIPI